MNVIPLALKRLEDIGTHKCVMAYVLCLIRFNSDDCSMMAQYAFLICL